MKDFKVGEKVLYTGKLYTARDQAHKRLTQAIAEGKKLPLNLEGQIIYYCGPARAPQGKIIGSCGPTTSSRMDNFVLPLLKAGLFGMIGKGYRSAEVISAIRKYGAVYFLTYSGCGALLSQYVTKQKLAAYPDLGPEAIYELEVRDFPLIVAIDGQGRYIYEKTTKGL